MTKLAEEIIDLLVHKDNKGITVEDYYCLSHSIESDVVDKLIDKYKKEEIYETIRILNKENVVTIENNGKAICATERAIDIYDGIHKNTIGFKHKNS